MRSRYLQFLATADTLLLRIVIGRLPVRARLYFLTVMLFGLFAPSIGSADGIDGFRGFRFGMSVEAAQTMGVLTPQENGEIELGRWYNYSRPETVDGLVYQVALLFNGNSGLISVNLSRRVDAHDALCTSHFSSALSSLQASFGTPDQPPERLSHGGIMTNTTARFSFRDGSRIVLTSIFIGDCSISVALLSPREGGGF